MNRDINLSINKIYVIFKVMGLTECHWNKEESQRQNSGAPRKERSYRGANKGH